MSGPAIHHMIADELRKIAEAGNFDATDKMSFQKLLKNPNNLHWYYIGAQGPDYLFFLPQDYREGKWHLGGPAKIFIEVLNKIRDIENRINKAIPKELVRTYDKINEIVDEAKKRSASISQIKKLESDVKKPIEALAKIVKDGLIDTITDNVNPFDIFKHPYRDGIKGKNPENWWYFDALHYRYTGRYAEHLLAKSLQIGGPARLYALGYLSHFAADTVGHPYVNIITGGPYRNGSQRHKVGENWQDLAAFRSRNHSPKNNLNFSELHKYYCLPEKGLVNLTGLPQFDRKLIDFITDTINDIYQVDDDGDQKNDFGKKVTVDQIEASLLIWHKWWKSSTSTGTLPAPEPYRLDKELAEIYNQAKRNIGDIGKEIGRHAKGAGSGGLWGLFKALAALIIGSFAMAIAILDAVVGMGIALSTSQFRAILAMVYEHLYDGWQNLRLAVALKGLAYPLLEHENHPKFRQFSHPAALDPSGTSATQLRNHLPLLRWPPRMQKADGSFGARKPPDEAHLIYAPLHVTDDGIQHGELPEGLLVVPPQYFNNDHCYYAFGGGSTDAELLTEIAEIQGNLGGDPGGVTALQDLPWSEERNLGDAVQLTRALFERWSEGHFIPIPDFNLDADRGYGFLCWMTEDNDGHSNAPGRLKVQPPDKPRSEDIKVARESEVNPIWI